MQPEVLCSFVPVLHGPLLCLLTDAVSSPLHKKTNKQQQS